MPYQEDKNTGTPSNSYRNYVLVMLMVVYVFNFIDRQVLVILQESIKKELHLSDTQLGVLSGFTFAIFYVSFGIPIARLADRGNRRNIVAISLGIWSMMTAFSGFAKNYIQLLLARVGVGIGEAGGSPPAHAMISDYFPPEKRSTALSIYSMGIYIGVLIGFILGGYLNQELGWRTAFFVLGIPGVIFSLLFYFTVKEPVKGSTDKVQSSKGETHSLKQVLQFLYSKKTFVYLALASGLHTFCIYSMSNWAPSFLSRLHGMQNSAIGVSLGLIFGIGGMLGTFTGGFLTDHFGKKDKCYYLKIPAYAIIISIPFVIGTLFFQETSYSLICLSIVAFLHSMFLGPVISVSHSLVPASMRAFTSAILFLVINLVGLGFGPLLVGIVSDLLKPSLGVESLRWAMASTTIIAVISVSLFFVSVKKMTQESNID